MRFLAYANEFRIKALIAASATLANVANKQNVLDMLTVYDQVDDVRRDHGPLGAVYPAAGWSGKPGMQEGDTPTFLYLLSGTCGLAELEVPTLGGWGGRFVSRAPGTRHFVDAPEGTAAVSRWREADGPRLRVRAPAVDAAGTVHLILEVTEAGEPPLTRDHRVILRLGEPTTAR